MTVQFRTYNTLGYIRDYKFRKNNDLVTIVSDSVFRRYKMVIRFYSYNAILVYVNEKFRKDILVLRRTKLHETTV